MSTIDAFVTTIGLIYTAVSQLLFPEPTYSVAQAPVVVQEEFSYNEEQTDADQYVSEASSLEKELETETEAETAETETETEAETETETETEETETETETETEELSPEEIRLKRSAIYNKYLEAKNVHSDVYGWLSISSLSMDYPIAYSGDDFYLEHDLDGNKTKEGTIYLDKNSNGKWGKVNLINGHNMKSGKMFGMLGVYDSEEETKKHLTFQIATEGLVENYKIFSIIIADSDTEELKLSFKNDNEFRRYIKLLASRSKYTLDVDYNTSRIVILNTCTYEFSGSRRLVCAYKVG